MRVELLEIAGVTLSPAVRYEDDRGSFVKLCDDDLGVNQVCVSTNPTSGTLRGLHLQGPPAFETKRLWCSHGKIFDVVVDTRVEEKTYGQWAAVELDGSRPALLTVPPGVAHGFQTLTDDASVCYLIEGAHAPECARTIRWDDSSLAIQWPRAVTRISPADSRGESWPLSW